MEWVDRTARKRKEPQGKELIERMVGGYSADFAIFLNFEKNRMLNYNEEDKNSSERISAKSARGK